MNSPTQAQDAARRRVVLLLLAALLALLLLLGLGVGSVWVSPWEVASILLARLGWSGPWEFSPAQEAIIWTLRLPRVLLAAASGAGLAVAGAGLQGMFRNPLADPGLIGVSAGGALGAALVLVLLPASLAALWGLWLLPMAAFLGGSLATWIIFRVSTWRGVTSVATMLLAGIAINALVGSLLGLLAYLAPSEALRSMTLWTLGSFSGASWSSLLVVLVALVVALAALLGQAPALNALLLGQAEARHLGVDVGRLQRVVVAASALVVGAVVGFCGLVGFVGLVVPHLLRLVLGPDHRGLLPGSALLGACLLVIADLAARSLVAPAELPVGILTALLGAPFFLWLMLRQRRGEGLL